MTPVTECFVVTQKSSCNGRVELSFSNTCGVDIIGVERRSSVQNTPPGYPPFQGCLQPWQEAKDAQKAPPVCTLAAGQKDIGFVEPGDTLSFEYQGAPLTMVLKARPPTSGSASSASSDDDGCSMTAGPSSREASGVAWLAAMALCVVARRRRVASPTGSGSATSR
jgi:hypothetical protein